MERNSSTRSLNAMISVGQTNVLQIQGRHDSPSTSDLVIIINKEFTYEVHIVVTVLVPTCITALS